MPIQIAHLSRYPSGKINPSATLCNIINAQIGATNLKVTGVDFLSLISQQPLEFRIKLEHAGEFRHELSILTNLLSDFTITTNVTQTSSEIHISNPRAILHIFNYFEYDSLKEADLLQLLLAETIYIILNKNSLITPQLVEFDGAGNISTIIISNVAQKQYKFANIQDVCVFLSQYCDVNLPTHFIDLLHQQLAIQAMREIQALTLVTDVAVQPPLFHNNKFLDTQFISSSKQFVFTLKPCSERTALILIHFLSLRLGDDFIVLKQENKLLISPANACGFTQVNVNNLAELTLNTFQLLTPTQAADLFANDITGAPIHSMPEPVEKILSCKISFDLPSGTPYITPHGLSYDRAFIMQNIDIYGDDPFTKADLDDHLLRPNLLIERIIASYQGSTLGYTATTPPLLFNPRTHMIYKDPVVLESGETVDRNEVINAASVVYPNRDLANLIEYYTPNLSRRYDLEVLSNLLRDNSLQNWSDKREYLTALQATINLSSLILSTRINNTPITYNQAEIAQHSTFTLTDLLRSAMPVNITHPQTTPPPYRKFMPKAKRYYADSDSAQEPSIINLCGVFRSIPFREVLPSASSEPTKHARLN